jgi:diguanylate cyclase (GGDEF)-like protein
MGVVGGAPMEQAQRILADSQRALGFEYAELGQQLPDGEYTRLCAIGNGADVLPAGIGVHGIRREKPYMVFDVLQDPSGNDSAVRALGLRSMLFWPFTWDGSRCVLTIAWKTPRDEFVSEDEIRYLDLLASLASRLLEVMERERRIAARADTDLLTGIPNRAALLEHLNREISAAGRNGSPLAVLYIDLNDFKKVNDQYGHAAGDAALRVIAARIQSVLRKHEMCARVGGDEFCVVVSAFKEEDELAVISRRILDALREPLVHDGITLTAAASVGIAVHPRDGTTIEDLLAHADRAMYRAKRERGGAYAFHASAATAVERPVSVEHAAFLSQFMMCYQPIISARSGRPIAAEVLPRWLQPEGMRTPQAFLQAARDQSVLPQLEAMIARVVADKAAENRTIADIAYHINISEPGELLVDALPNYAPSFAVEVTEQQVAAEPFRYIAFAEVCRSRGQRFGISSFGADQLSLRTLTELRPDFVKVRVGRNEADREALSMLIEQAHRLSCYVIGEAIETAAERQWFVANGVDALQGFEICSPLAEQDFFAWLRRYRYAAAR